MIGKDSEDKEIHPYDTVEVIGNEKGREGKPHFAFCCVGKQGYAIGTGWWYNEVNVVFKGPNGKQTVGCREKNLRVVKKAPQSFC